MKRPSVRTHLFLQVLRHARRGTVEIQFPDGKSERFGEGEPTIHARASDWDVFDLMFSKGDLGLAEAILGGGLVVDDIAALVEWACRNDHALAQAIYGSWYGNLAARIKRILTANNRIVAKQNTIAHYDLGNEFYRLWLDRTMTYSSAIFKAPDETLETAQNRKYDRIVEALNIKSGDRVLEIGCGWGGFFSHAIAKTGCHVTAVSNSPEQTRFNGKRIAESGLGGHVSLLQCDYRDIQGRFDKIVSIEMIEAVGEKYWNTYFAKVGHVLKAKGAAMIQGITIQDDLFYSYRKNTDFIQRYVFPGGMLLTHKAFTKNGHAHALHLADTFEFAGSYAQTLRRWRENFQAAKADVQAMGFDDRFLRLWNLYLSYCEGAFRAGRVNVGQFLLER